jgi:NAD-reducing hydrogenase large subunit
MERVITIDPVTRIEGHARISILLDETGRVSDAKFHVTQFRGFEKLCEGRPFYEMPSLMARICGICPVSHLIASAKACDAILAVQIPPTATGLRQVLNLAQLLQSHALSFFYLSSPDFVLGLDADPSVRNLVGVLGQEPELARAGIRLRQFGQQIIERLAGKRIHPAWVVPGGVNKPLEPAMRDAILAELPECQRLVERTLSRVKQTLEAFREEIRTFGNFPSLFFGLVNERGHLEFYDGLLRIVDAGGRPVLDGFDPVRYAEIIEERVEPWSYLKSPYYKPSGYPDGIYRVGPLARLNIADGCGTPRADQEWAEFRELERGAILSSFHYHYARLIEMLYATERLEQLLASPAVLGRNVRAQASPNASEGIGVAEAPRGTLLHHYRIDENGLITSANLIIATGHNHLAMNRAVLQVARHFIEGDTIPEGMLNRVEAVIRAYDPCLSCSTHAAGSMPLVVRLVASDGQVVAERTRG